MRLPGAGPWRWAGPLAAVVLVVACDGGADEPTAPDEPDEAAGQALEEEPADEGETAEEVELISEGRLVVCLDAPVEPFVVADGDAEIGFAGFEVGVLSELADRMELELEVEPARVERIQSGRVLGAERCDLGGSGLAVTDRRAEQVDFTRPYFQARQAVLVAQERRGELGEIAEVDHLDALEDLGELGGLEGLRVGVRADGPGQQVAERYLEDAEVVPFEQTADLLPALLVEDVDVVLRDLVAGAPAIAAVDGVEIAVTVPAGNPYAFALRAGRGDGLRAAVDEELDAMEADGTLDRLVEESFGLE
jgi:polar amino acid transport system substrate-binding protein